MFLFAVAVEAQSLPDVARQERERRASLKPVFVLTPENLKESATASTTTPTDEAKPATAVPTTQAAPADEAAAKKAEAAKKEEAAKKYAELVSALRVKIVALEDQQTAVQLLINDLKNQFLAPVSDSALQAQAQAKLDQAQIQLSATQRDLADTRKQLQLLEAQGPPKP
jgi:hypothetical protein